MPGRTMQHDVTPQRQSAVPPYGAKYRRGNGELRPHHKRLISKSSQDWPKSEKPSSR